MHTQDEAKKTWCPEARVAKYEEGSNVAINRSTLDTNCIASACGMWRWVMVNQHGAGASFSRDGELTWTEIRGGKVTTTPPETARGYCGLAPLVTR